MRHLRGVHTNIVATLPFLPYLTNLEIKGYNTVSVHQQLSWQHCTVWTNLRRLRLTAVYFGDDLGLSAVANLPFLTSLSIMAANISFPLRQLSAVSVANLRSLQIARCSVFGKTGAELCSRLGGMTSLTSLQLSYLVCRPQLQGLHHLSSLSTLQRLDLTGTRLGHCAPECLQPLTCLSVLTCTHSYVPANLLEAFIYRAQQPQGSKVHMHEPPRTRTQDDNDNCQATWIWPH